MPEPAPIRIAPLMARMAVFVVLGLPLVGFLWHSLNRFLSGSFEPWRLGASLAAALLLAGLLHLLAGRIRRWESERPK